VLTAYPPGTNQAGVQLIGTEDDPNSTGVLQRVNAHRLERQLVSRTFSVLLECRRRWCPITPNRDAQATVAVTGM
jgi:hypothetical protein